MFCADDDEYLKLFRGMCTYKGFQSCANGKRLRAIGRDLAVALTATAETAYDVYSTTIIFDRTRRVVKWNATNATGISNILVLFAEEGTFIYKPTAPVKSGYFGNTNKDIISELERVFGPSTHIAWAGDAAMSIENTRLKVEVATLQRQVAALMCANITPQSVAVKYTAVVGNSFHTYERHIRGFPYDFSPDFRPDRVPAAQWDAGLLYRYLYENRSKPDCVFPRLINIVSWTPRFDTNCDFGVIFEHPVTMEEVSLDMCKAFATVCKAYRLAAHAYLTFKKVD